MAKYPTLSSGIAFNRSQSFYPSLWDGLVGAWCPAIGKQGSTLFDFSLYFRHGVLNNFSEYTVDLTVPGGTITADTTEPAHPPSNAINNSSGLPWSSTNTPFPHWIKYDFGLGSEKIINQYTIRARSDFAVPNRLPRDFTLEGSNNDINWTILDTRVGITFSTGETKTFNLFSGGINTTPYRFYRIHATANNGDANWCQIEELELQEFNNIYVPSKFGFAIRYDGLNDFVHIGNIPQINDASKDLSFSYWIRTSTVQTNHAMFYYDIDNALSPAVDIYCMFKGNFTVGGIGDGSEWNTGYPSSNFQDGKWHHIAIVLRGLTEYLYHNGKLAASRAVAHDHANYGTSHVFRLADDANVAHYTGDIENFFVYNRALSISEVISFATGGSPLTLRVNLTNGFRPLQEVLLDETITINDQTETNQSLDKVNIFESISIQEITNTKSIDLVTIEENLNINEDIQTQNAVNVSIEENIFLNETHVLSETLDLADNILISEQLDINQTLDKIDISESISFSETIETQEISPVFGAVKIIHINPLIIVTDTDPVQVVEIDITDPNNPTFIKYVINDSGFTFRNAKDVVLNETFNLLYVAGAEGQILKLDAGDLTIREQIDTGDSNDLLGIVTLDAHHKLYASTDFSKGEILMVDNSSFKAFRSDIRTIEEITRTLQSRIDLNHTKTLKTDIRFLAEVSKTLKTDIRFFFVDPTDVPTIPSPSFDDLPLSVINRPDFVVKIDGVEASDLKLDSIVIEHFADEESKATFILARRHDELDKRLDGTPSQITNQNIVDIFINGRLEFTGKIGQISARSREEIVEILAFGDIKLSNNKTISVPMSSLNEKLHPTHVILQNPTIENPPVDPNDENPKFFKGIKTDLGTVTRQRVLRFRTIVDLPAGLGFQNTGEASLGVYAPFSIPALNLGTAQLGDNSLGKVAQALTNGTFKPKQNWTYFWGPVTLTKLELKTGLVIGPNQGANLVTDLTNYFNRTEEQLANLFDTDLNTIKARLIGRSFTADYLGTSMAPAMSDLWEILQVRYKYQRVLDDTISGIVPLSNPSPGFVVTSPIEDPQLGDLVKVKTEYFIGEAPFKDVNFQNGVFVPAERWEDKSNGLYEVTDEGYNYAKFAKQSADLEYEKILTINGSVFPRTSTEINLMIDGYYYYGISTLTRLNIVNTTTPGIYSNNNGFPVSVKSITIDSFSMLVTIRADNQLSLGELLEIEQRFPDPSSNEFLFPEKSLRIATKFDINRAEDVN